MDLVNLVQEYGVKNLRFFFETEALDNLAIGLLGIGLKVGGTQRYLVEYEITEERYQIGESNKVGFTPVRPEIAVTDGKRPLVLRFGNESFYISDFESLHRHGTHRVFIVNIDGYQEVTA